MPKISATVHKTLKKLDSAIAIVAPRRGTSAAVVLGNQLKAMLQSGRPFDIRWGDTTRKVDPDQIRIHKSTVTFMLDDQDFPLQLSLIGYVPSGEKDGDVVYSPGFVDDETDRGISFEQAEEAVAMVDKKARRAA